MVVTRRNQELLGLLAEGEVPTEVAMLALTDISDLFSLLTLEFSLSAKLWT